MNSVEAGCGSVFYALPAVGSYWITVGGMRPEDEGIFTLTLSCSDIEAKAVDDSCAYS
jgi:hypothetical protein